MKKNALLITVAVVFTILLIGCNSEKNDAVGDSNNTSLPTDNTDDLYMDSETNDVLLGNYTYPDHPAEDLRRYLATDAESRGLPMEIGDVETTELNGSEYSQIKIDFTNGNGNVCIISFFIRSIEYDYEITLDGRDNPSFTMSFKDENNSQDMVTLLTSVMMYLSPGLSLEEAERLAINQDKTIGAGGYSQPYDISGYQVQAQCMNPYVFASTTDFEAKLGVNVRALKQIWHGALDTQNCQELLTPNDYDHLTAYYDSWDEGYPDMVYGDFIVKNMWHEQSYLHGETWVVVDLESITGQHFSISLDTWTFPIAYEFGVGQQYTLYIGLSYVSGVRGGIMYAVQQTESALHNSRGAVQPLDHPSESWRDHPWRIEPEGEGTVYDVHFMLQSQSYGTAFAALEGHGVGEQQWPKDPGWEGYTFVGWYDNLAKTGNPYTKDTPIFGETRLYPKWEYTGGGGVWPRAYRGDIQGIEESIFAEGQKVSITASGYNMNLESLRDQRFRWRPVSWRISNGTSGSFSGEAPFVATLPLDDKGEHVLFLTYLEEVFDGVDWQETGQVHEVAERVFIVNG